MTFPAPSSDKKILEEGGAFTPKFDSHGLIVCVTVEASSGEILMLAYMNALALEKTLETGIVHYWSRSRKELWRKGDTSGQVQKVVDIRVDCDQDALLLRVEPGGDGKACHTGRKSCFYRKVTAAPGGVRLELL
jgi:phosphoribosyl-AMP cyclohydrolase